MSKKAKVFAATVLGLVLMALVANGTVVIKNEWLGLYPGACPDLLAAAESCDLCHGAGFALNPYAQDRLTFGSFSAIENIDSDGDTVVNLNEIQLCTLPGDASSFVPTTSATWSGIKALYR